MAEGDKPARIPVDSTHPDKQDANGYGSRKEQGPMYRSNRRLWFGVVLCGAVGALGVACQIPGAEPAREQAREILDTAGVTGGLIVHLGCGDGRLTAALRAGEAYTVQGLDRDAGQVEAARRYLQSLGLYGPVSAERLSGKRLPYVDDLVSLVVAEDLGPVPMEEVLRVLAPLGVAYVKRGDGWVKTVKPWPEGMDEWPQHFYDGSNNAVSRDCQVGPPRHYQWIAEPQWMRSHMSMPSITSMVSSRGRLFTIEDEGTAEHPALPGQFALIARDAFNGIVLWRVRFPDWHPINIRTKLTPVQIQRRLAAIGDVVYCTPGYAAPITALDAATGKVLKTFPGTERTTEFVYDSGTLFVVTGDQTDTLGIAQGGPLGESQFPPRAYGPRIRVTENPQSTILAVDAESGRQRWRMSGAETAGYQGGSLAVRGDCVVYSTAEELVCADRATGHQRWRVPAPIVLEDRIGIGGAGVSLVLSDQAAYLADSQTIRAYRLDDGSQLWRGKAVLNHHKPPDVFLAAGVVWSNYFDGHDPLTGRIVKRLTQKMIGPMGHDRCYRNRITERFYINTKTGGSDFVAFEGSVEFPNPWVRSTCGIGHLPANGLLYCGPPACSCCNWVMLNAMNALAPEPGLKSSPEPIPVETRPRLEKGPAYGRPVADASAPAPDDWPTYRHDPGRSGVTGSRGPAGLEPVWEAKLLTRPSAPVIAAGKVFVADVDAHAVCALDGSDGRLLWRYTTGARVDSPPTYYRGLVLFGSHDGWVYCLTATDGALVWRFRELPERRICAYGQVESAWPVSGSVLLADGVAYFAAGRNSFLDGGIFLYGLDPETGRVIYRRHLYGPYGPDGFPIITSRIASGVAIDGTKTDILLTDGRLLYMRQQAFKLDLTPLRPEDPRPPHLIPSPGFLESIPHHRTFWTIDTTIRYDIPAGHQAAHGDILALDGNRFYEVRGYTPARISPFDPRPQGYTLFAGVYRQVDKTIVQQRGRKRRPRRLSVRSVADQRWVAHIPLAGKALVVAEDTLFVAGTPVKFPPDDLAAAYAGRMGGVLWAGSATTGQKQAQVRLDAPPSWDGMAVAQGRVFIALQDGRLLCLGDR